MPWTVAATSVGALLAFLGTGRAEPASRGEEAFGEVARVLLSPRCRNCHPAGDAPLQGDAKPHRHRMNVRRGSPERGLLCASCHREVNHPRAGGPPGAPGWAMPSAATPMVFEGRSPHDLCVQLKDRASNGGRDLKALREHLATEPLVLWSFDPGPGRTKPPLSHAAMMTSFDAWVAAGAPCPR
jgi:hypothetical protein